MASTHSKFSEIFWLVNFENVIISIIYGEIYWNKSVLTNFIDHLLLKKSTTFYYTYNLYLTLPNYQVENIKESLRNVIIQ